MSELTTTLVDLAAAGATTTWSDVEGAHGRLVALAGEPVDADLLTWAHGLEASALELPLVGLGRLAATYPSLVWNGVRLRRAGLGVLEGLLLVGLASRTDTSTTDDLVRAVAAGVAVDAALQQVLDGSDRVGVPTTSGIAAAACAGVLGGVPLSDLGVLLDLAAGLMVVGGRPTGQADLDGLLLGHGLAAGWLAPRVAASGIVPMPGAVEHTLDVYAMNLTVLVPDVATTPDPRSSGAPKGVSLADLAAALG
jgi:hypothetical protein